jgi:hypothetical protein
MPEEFEDLNSRMPDFASALTQRIVSKKAEANPTLPPPGTVDPYQVMLSRKKAETGDIDPNTIQKWPDDAVKKLQDYCDKMGIYGFNSGRMHPSAALAMLKKQFGEDYTGVPLEERVPSGYEKCGTPSTYGPNYPYSDAIKQKQILHG